MMCPECREETTPENPPTRDHVIPKWLIKRMHMFTGEKATWKKAKKGLGLAQVNVREICAKCNGKKGPFLDFRDPTTREVCQKIVDHLTKELNKSL